MAKNSRFFYLLEALFNSVEDLGIKETTEILQKSIKEELTLQDERVSFILQIVSNLYQIPIEEIINSNEKSPKRINSFKFVVYYLREVFYMSFPEIGLVLNKSTSYVFKKHKELKSIKRNKKHELQSKFEKLDLLVTEYQLKNK